MEQTCIRCKYFKVEDHQNGFCRVETMLSGDRTAQKPRVGSGDSCARWVDCGQQYHIRRGWIKAYLEQQAQAES